MTDTARRLAASRKLNFLLALLLVIAALLLVRDYLVENVAERRLRAYADLLAQQAQTEKRTFILDFDAVDSSGLGAVIYNPRITVSDKNDRYVLSTRKAFIYPRAFDFSSFAVVIPQNITIQAGDVYTSTLSTPEPFNLQVDWQKGKETTFRYVFALPQKLLLHTLTKSAVTEESSEEITLNPGGYMDVTLSENGNLLEADVHIKNLVSKDVKEQYGFSIASLRIDSDREMKNESLERRDIMFDLQGFSLDSGLRFGKISMSFDAFIEGTPPVSLIGLLTTDPGNAKGEIEKLELTTDLFRIQASGGFITSDQDLYPSGKGEVRVENFEALVNDLSREGVLNAEGAAMLNDMVLKSTGKVLAETKDLALSLERQPQGTLKIGQASLEEMIAIVFSAAPAVPGVAAEPSTDTPPSSVTGEPPVKSDEKPQN